MSIAQESRGRRCAAVVALIICACFGVWKLHESFSTRNGRNRVSRHYLLLQEQWTKIHFDQRSLRGFQEGVFSSEDS